MGMSGFYGPADESESIATIHAALDAGITLLDTSDYYGAGHNELLIGRGLRDRRDKARVRSWPSRLAHSDWCSQPRTCVASRTLFLLQPARATTNIRCESSTASVKHSEATCGRHHRTTFALRRFAFKTARFRFVDLLQTR